MSFNGSVAIRIRNNHSTHISSILQALSLCQIDGRGQEVVRLVDQVQAAGRYEAVWNGTNITGAGVSSGIYLYRITGGSGYTEAKRMTLLK